MKRLGEKNPDSLSRKARENLADPDYFMTGSQAVGNLLIGYPLRSALTLGTAAITGLLGLGYYNKVLAEHEAQSNVAAAEVKTYTRGTLLVRKGVRTYDAPDTQGRHHDPSSGKTVDGNEVFSGTTQKKMLIQDPAEYIDPDSEEWLGFTVHEDGEAKQVWIKSEVVNQTAKNGNHYAEWAGEQSPTSIPSVVFTGEQFVDPSQVAEMGSPLEVGIVKEEHQH